MIENKKIIFYDGLCAMCNRFIRILITLDKKEKLLLAPLQGKNGKILKEKFSKELKGIDSVIFYNKKVYTKSSAVINILSELGGIYKLAYIFNIIPSFISDSIYDYIARNRFQWFGKLDKCPMPEKKNISRFLD
jgi:predicted DCC family thiol-disulfide oxidoreductase YuxK